MRVIRGDDQVLAGLKLDGLSVDEHTSADFWSLGVKHDTAGLVWSLLEGLLDVLDGLAVGLQYRKVRK